MGCLTNYGENVLLDHTLKVTSYTHPTHWYLAYCLADPGEAATGSTISEPSGGSYARQICDSWATAVSRATSNAAKITFPAATGDWGLIPYFAICDDLAAGNVIAYGPVTPNKSIFTGDIAESEIGDLDISWNTGALSDYLANALLDHTFPTGIAFSVPNTIYTALTPTTIVDTDTGATLAEPSGGSYARVAHNAWNAASGGASSNNGDIEFVTATAGWGTIASYVLNDASTIGSGNNLFYGNVTVAKPVDDGDTARFLSGLLDITLD